MAEANQPIPIADAEVPPPEPTSQFMSHVPGSAPRFSFSGYYGGQRVGRGAVSMFDVFAAIPTSSIVALFDDHSGMQSMPDGG